MNNFKLGQYVQYGDQPWLIVKIDDSWLYLNNGTIRRKISYRNAKLLNIEPAKKAKVDGSKYLEGTEEGSISDPEVIGINLAEKLIADGANEILGEIRK